MKLKSCAAGLAGASLLAFAAAAVAASPVVVDCAAGGSVGAALADSPPVNKPVVIVVKGVCSEHVSVDRNDVTLVADANGGGLAGPDPATDVVRVTGARVTIEGLAISGGRTGITGEGAPGLKVSNVTVHNTGRNGITYTASSGQIANTTVQSVARDGVFVEGSSVFITGSTVSNNARLGIAVVNNGSARIGFDPDNQVIGNTIAGNGSNGVHVSFGATSMLVGNQITGNGATVPSPLGRSGIAVYNASVSLVGSNNISGNSGAGIFLRSGSLLSADPSFGVPTTNTVSGNGDAGSPGGVVGFLGSSLLVRDMMISANNGPGLALVIGTTGQLFNTQIRDNVSIPAPNAAGDGIRLSFDSSLVVSSTSSATGNGNFGLSCSDSESSSTTGFLILSGNAAGDFPNCSGF